MKSVLLHTSLAVKKDIKLLKNGEIMSFLSFDFHDVSGAYNYTFEFNLRLFVYLRQQWQIHIYGGNEGKGSR